jgi:two-component system, OmpR family, KDP operon response regulator KdpE
MTLAPKRLRALIIDDEKSIRRFLRTTLIAEDFDVVEAETAATGLALARETKPDLVVLDLGLPDGDGATLIAPVLGFGAPAILVLSALDEESRKVTALDLGADDFVTKPFGVAEFMARVRAALRHRLRMQGGSPVYDDGRLSLDLVKRLVRVNGVDPKLTPREYALLRELAIHAGKVLTHRHLMAKCWEGPDEPDIQVLRVHMRNLRQKIEESPEQPALIVTEQGVGYRFLGKGEATAAT